MLKQRNLNKVQEVKQKPSEDPSEFLERSLELIGHTQIQALRPQRTKRWSVSLSFVRAPLKDGRNQKSWKGILGVLMSLLAEIPFKVFNGRDWVQEKKEQWRIKWATLPAAALI